MKKLHWSWEHAYKKLFFLRFFLLLVVLGLSIALLYITFCAEKYSNNDTVQNTLVSTKFNDLKTYKNAAHGFSFSYPASFVVDDQTDRNGVDDLVFKSESEYLFVANAPAGLSIQVTYIPLTIQESKERKLAYAQEFYAGPITPEAFTIQSVASRDSIVFEDGSARMGQVCVVPSYFIPLDNGTLYITIGKCEPMSEDGDTTRSFFSKTEKATMDSILHSLSLIN